MQKLTMLPTEEVDDWLPIIGTDYIEFYVGNAKQAAHYYQTAFGFQPLAYCGPETGIRDRASYVLRQGKICLMLTAPLYPKGDIAEHLLQHGDGVKAVALQVDDAEEAFRGAIERGAEPYFSPEQDRDDRGTVVRSGIKLYGDTVHIFVERKNYEGIFLPRYFPWEPEYRTNSAGLTYVDHCVANVGWNEMNQWVDFYERVMGFRNIISFDDKTINTEYSALMSKVMSNGNGRIKFPINEPAEGKKKSQVEEYLDYYGCPGIQHVALATEDIIETVKRLKAGGVEFLSVPAYYYRDLPRRVGQIEEELEALRDLDILVDRDEEGYLLQIFTKPVEDRPTVFFEIIQRRGASSFGAGNFKALFEAIEREQAIRGNL
jgi:4-hydroxyphenylpyruvate dioxygenase